MQTVVETAARKRSGTINVHRMPALKEVKLDRDEYKLAMDFYDKSVADSCGQAGKATAYGSKMSRILRYVASARLPEFDKSVWSESSLLDVGCGPGQFYSWLEAHVSRPMKYSGIDPNEGMVKLATERGVPNVSLGDVFDSDEKFDWIVANCIFASAFVDSWSENLGIVSRTIQQMWSRCNFGVCFDVVYGEDSKMIHDVQPGYHELQFKPMTILKIVERTMTKRIVVDRATSDRFFTVYAFKRPQLFERMSEENF